MQCAKVDEHRAALEALRPDRGARVRLCLGWTRWLAPGSAAAALVLGAGATGAQVVAGSPTPVAADALPQPVQQAPVIVQVEDGTLGSQFTIGESGDDTYVVVEAQPTLDPGAPGSPERVVRLEVTFPAPGVYDLYLRSRTGGSGSDDSFFYGSGFGAKDPARPEAWVVANNLSTVGFARSTDIVTGAVGLDAGVGFRWLNLSLHNGGEPPLTFTVPPDALTQILELGAREDGLAIDRLAFVPVGVSQTVAELDQGLPGRILPPPPPPRTCTPRGPALASGHSKFLGGVYSGAQLPNFVAYFNQVTPENAGKWGSVEGVRDVMNWTELDAAYALAKTNGFPFKLHTLIWGNQQPAWISSLPAAEQLEEIEEWYAAVSERYPNIDIVEVVNEPLHDPPSQPDAGGGNYLQALGGHGTPEQCAAPPYASPCWDWIMNAFRLARRYFPASELMINDYSIINNPADVIRYKGIVARLQTEDLIDAIGEQGHAFSTRGPSDVMQAGLDSLAELGLPLMITELDIDGPSDEVQLADFQRIFPLFWQHPAVTGVTLWGYRPGHWRSAQGAYLALAEGTERPALAWLRDYLGNPADSPVLAGQVITLREDATPGQVVGRLRSSLEGPANWLVWPGSAAQQFSVDAGTGQVSLAPGASMAGRAGSEIELLVTAGDECAPERVTVRVARANTAPRFASPNVISLDTQLRGTVRAVDAEGDRVSYRIVGGSAADAFNLDAATGALSPARTFVLGRQPLVLSVVASDAERPSVPVTFTLAVPAQVQICAQGANLTLPRDAARLATELGARIGACPAAPPRSSLLERAIEGVARLVSALVRALF